MKFSDLQNLGRGYVLASGCFDLLHIGHVRYLKEAAKHGPLIVALTEGRYFTKPGRPVFTDDERLEMVESLAFVRHAVMVPERTMVSAIEFLKPMIYVKGSETQLTGNPDFQAEKEAVERHGGIVMFIQKVVPYSSGALLNGSFLK